MPASRRSSIRSSPSCEPRSAREPPNPAHSGHLDRNARRCRRLDQAMKRFLMSPMSRAFVLIMVGNVAFGIWIRPDVKRAAAVRTEDAPAWAVVLLIVSLAILAYCVVEVYLIHVLRERPPRDL